jgi:membrane protein DedA with SNARE-associated domain
MELVVEYVSQYGYWGIMLLLTLGIVGLPVPDEVLMIFVGYVSSIGVLSYSITVIAGILGSLMGMMISYFVGRKIGHSLIVKYGRWVGLTQKRFDKMQRWFSRYGIWSILFAYFIPGLRHVAGYISGIGTMPITKYLFICIIVSIVWTVLYTSIGYYIGWKQI